MGTLGFKIASGGVGLSVTLVVAASVLAVTWGFHAEESKGDPSQDPCYNLSDEECQALIQKSEREAVARMEVWLADFNTRDVDLRSLPTAELMADYLTFPETLDDAIAAADAIVVGQSRDITFQLHSWAPVEFGIDQSVKGPLFGETIVMQPGGPEPYPDWDGGVRLGIARPDPLLLPGDRAILFLEFHEDSRWYEVQPPPDNTG
jgi:hypothetical protein